MNFVTLEFATFFLFVLVAGWLLRERDGEYRAFLLVCNLFFYALAGMAFVPLLLAVGGAQLGGRPPDVPFFGAAAQTERRHRAGRGPACGPAGVLQVL